MSRFILEIRTSPHNELVYENDLDSEDKMEVMMIACKLIDRLRGVGESVGCDYDELY